MNNLSDKFKSQMQMVALFIGVIAGLAGLLGAWVVIPYRVQALESSVASKALDHDILVSIKERLILMSEESGKTRPETEAKIRELKNVLQVEMQTLKTELNNIVKEGTPSARERLAVIENKLKIKNEQ